jgi:hypothetical protein
MFSRNRNIRHDEDEEETESKWDSTKQPTFETPLNKDEVDGKCYRYKAGVFGCDGSSKYNSAKQWNVDFSLLEGNTKDDFVYVSNHYRKSNEKLRSADKWNNYEILPYVLSSMT